jgi:hypothetical protein
MSYRVIKYFTDMQDNNHEYNVGDIYPREELKVFPSRIRELSTTENRRGEILIKEVEDEPKAENKNKKAKKADEE